MSAEWIASPTVRQVVGYVTDLRPVWFWSGDGDTLIWSNAAALAVGARMGSGRPALPIGGQVARAIRLGIKGRPSLSRMQFEAGRKPLSLTCTCTPLEWRDKGLGLLIVGVDPLEPEQVDGLPVEGTGLTGLFGSEIAYTLLDAGGNAIGGRGEPEETGRQDLAAGPDGMKVQLSIPGEAVDQPPEETIALPAEEEAEPQTLASSPPPAMDNEQSGESDGQGTIAEDEQAAPDDTADAGEPHRDDEPSRRSLSQLFDQLATSDELFTPLDARDDAFDPHVAESWEERPNEAVSEQPHEAPEQPDDMAAPASNETASTPASQEEPMPAADRMDELDAEAEARNDAFLTAVEEEVRAEADLAKAQAEAAPEDGGAQGQEKTSQTGVEQLAADLLEANEAQESAATPASDRQETTPVPEDERQILWRLVSDGYFPEKDPAQAETDSGTGSTPAEPDPKHEAQPESGVAAPDATLDTEAMERASRYNFDELSRILVDRVSAEPERRRTDASGTGQTGALFNLSDETLILNRLPIGLMVFRDQKILFSNRALAEMTGHPDAQSLRAAGLASVFPEVEGEDGPVGPVAELRRADGGSVRVSARLQAVSWQGRPALMLSARREEEPAGIEHAVRTFARTFAETLDAGFLETDRQGTLTSVSLQTARMAGQPADALKGQSLRVLVSPDERTALSAFLERPARFAGGERPSQSFAGRRRGERLTLFAEGSAGIVSGYFGILRAAQLAAPAGEDEREPVLLGRISRSVRRPLNTIVGFSELIRSAAFGPLSNQRYVDYARDIEAAGLDIAALVDELDEYARLKRGDYAAKAEDVDLALLLEQCLSRVRGQAGAARVLLRSAISETLPHIRADGQSLAQAVLNMLASAIDQTPEGAQVVLTAHQETDGSVVVHVRDSSGTAAERDDRFIVFRDGVGPDGRARKPSASTIGLALTRSLLAVNACSLSLGPTAGMGTLMSLVIPAELSKTIASG